ncbi:MAG: elongation factor P [Patescibacteria group bacterium]
MPDFKKGMAIKHEGETYVITSAQHVNPGKGAAFTRCKMKNVRSDRSIEVTFKSGENVDEADMQFRKCQYLYKDAESFYFMDMNSFDQFALSKEMVGDQSNYLMDGSEITVVFVDDLPVSLHLQTKMDFKVISAPPGEKGDTASAGTKPVTIETGAIIGAPLFIKEGDTIRVNTETHEYTERVQK